jgi:ABC-2 type transport system ATP-binding protein
LVAVGAPAALKAEIGRPTVEVVPSDPAEGDRAAAILARFGEPVASVRGIAVRLQTGQADLAEIVRALDGEHLPVAQLQLHQASLDDVFLSKTGRSLEGADDDEEGQTVGGLAMEPA